jgi:hypothetical protein
LVIGRAKENHGTETSPCMTIVHCLKTTHLVPTFVKRFADIVHLDYSSKKSSEYETQAKSS